MSNEAKAQVLVPMIEKLLAAEQDASKRQKLQELATFAVSSFDALSAGDMNDTEKPTWDVYLKVLTATLTHGKNVAVDLVEPLAHRKFASGVWERARVALLHRLQHGLFTKLDNDRKTQLCRTWVQIGAADESLVSINDIPQFRALDLTSPRI